MGGLQDLRTAVKSKARTKPTVEGQEYLDMYVLARERARWARTAARAAIVLEGIDKEIERLGKVSSDFERERADGRISQPPQERAAEKLGVFRVGY